MEGITAVNNTVLDVDLTTGRIDRINISNADRRLYLGGKGLAVKLLYDHMKPGIDPLSPDSILIMMSGPTAGTAAPAGGRSAVATSDLSDYCGLLSGLLGYEIKRRELYEIGERIFNLERHMNCREGITRADDTLPHRILKEVREDGWPPVELEIMLDKYYRLRGWDEEGIPRPDTLGRLGITH